MIDSGTNGALLEPTAWALLHFLWQGALVALVAAGVLALQRGRSARWRYLTACAGLVAMAIFPLATAMVLYRSQTPASLVGATVEAVGSPASASASAAVSSPAAVPFDGVFETSGLAERLEPALPWLVALWAIGIAALSILHAGGWRRVHRLRRDVRPAPARWEAAVERLVHRLGISRPVRLYESARTRVPVVLGWLRPVILVPASALSGLTPQQLEAVLAHELAHVRRHDYLVNLFQLLVETVLFYHPGVWWMSRQVRIERENCCDDLAVDVCGNPVVYARALADLEELRFGAPAFALGADGGSLGARVRRLVGRGEARPAEGWLAVMIAALVAALVAALGMALLFVASSSNALPAAPEDGEPAETAETWTEPDPLAWNEPEDGDWDGSSDESWASAGDSWDDDDSWSDDEDSWSDDDEDTWSDEDEEDTWADEDEEDETGGRWWTKRDEEWFAEEVEDLRAAAAGTPYERLGDDELHKLAQYGFDGELFPALVDAGVSDADVGELARLAQHGLDGDDLREMTGAGLSVESTEDYVRLARYGLDGEDVRLYMETDLELEVDEIVLLARHGVDGEGIRGYAESGLAGLTAEEIVRLAKHGVDGDDARDFREAGFDLTPDQVVRLTKYGIDGDDAREYKRSGYTDIRVDDMVNLARYGLDGDDVAEYARAGLENLSVDDMLRLARYGVGGDDVSEYARAGLEASVDELLDLARYGVGGEDVGEYLASGFKGLTIEHMVSLARLGVDGDDLKNLRDGGHDLSVEEVIRLARRGELWELMD